MSPTIPILSTPHCESGVLSTFSLTSLPVWCTKSCDFFCMWFQWPYYNWGSLGFRIYNDFLIDRYAILHKIFRNQSPSPHYLSANFISLYFQHTCHFCLFPAPALHPCLCLPCFSVENDTFPLSSACLNLYHWSSNLNNMRSSPMTLILTDTSLFWFLFTNYITVYHLIILELFHCANLSPAQLNCVSLDDRGQTVQSFLCILGWLSW